MAKIKSVKGRQVFDSRGNPTVEAEIFLDDGSSATAISPSGASTGAFEAHELRDKEQNKFLGKSVNIAVQNINNKISNKLKKLDFNEQEKIDKILIELDGTEQKKKLGANAILGVSMACCKLAAIEKKIPVKPIYINFNLDNEYHDEFWVRRNRKQEKKAMNDIVKKIKEKYPYTVDLILPIQYINFKKEEPNFVKKFKTIFICNIFS